MTIQNIKNITKLVGLASIFSLSIYLSIKYGFTQEYWIPMGLSFIFGLSNYLEGTLTNG